MTWGMLWGSKWGIGSSEISFSDVLSEVGLFLPEYNPIDMFRKVGGFHTGKEVSDFVDSLFQPGTIVGSDSSEAYRDQYRKAFIRNVSGKTLRGVKVYGFNVKSNKTITFALEKGLDQVPILDGSEVIKDYVTPPNLFGTYDFTEIANYLQALQVGSDGVLSDLRGQGIWFRQRINKNLSDEVSDFFRLNVIWSS